MDIGKSWYTVSIDTVKYNDIIIKKESASMVVEKTKKNIFRKLDSEENLPFSSVLPELSSIILNSTNKSVIQKIYLFGSYAYGKPNKKSDLDICVVLDNIEEDLDIYLDISKTLFYKNIIRCDLLVYREEQFYRSKNSKSVEHVIMERGKILYER